MTSPPRVEEQVWLARAVVANRPKAASRDGLLIERRIALSGSGNAKSPDHKVIKAEAREV